jgi:hypothetical protein
MKDKDRQLQRQKQIPFGDDKQERQKQIPFGDDKQERQKQELLGKGLRSHPCRDETTTWMGHLIVWGGWGNSDSKREVRPR